MTSTLSKILRDASMHHPSVLVIETILSILMLGDVGLRCLLLGKRSCEKISSRIEILAAVAISLVALIMLLSRNRTRESEEIDVALLAIRGGIQLFRIGMYGYK